MARRQPDQFIAPTEEKSIAAEQYRVHALLDETCEGRINAALAAGL